MRILSFIVFVLLTFTALDVLLTVSNQAIPFIGGYVAGYILPYIPEIVKPSTTYGYALFQTLFLTFASLFCLAITGITKNMRAVYFFIFAISGLILGVNSLGWLNAFANDYPNVLAVSQTVIPTLNLAFLISFLLSCMFTVKEKAEVEAEAEDFCDDTSKADEFNE